MIIRLFFFLSFSFGYVRHGPVYLLICRSHSIIEDEIAIGMDPGRGLPMSESMSGMMVVKLIVKLLASAIESVSSKRSVTVT